MSAPGHIGLAQVEAALHQHHQGLESSYKVTPAGMWACSQTHEVHQLLAGMDLSPYRNLVDLGSGDGRVVLVASLFLPATGLEADPELVASSQKLAAQLGLDRARFFCADCRSADLSLYDLMFIYPDKPLDWLVQRLPPDWPGALLVYGPYFQPQGLSHCQTLYAGETLCTMWRR